MTEQDKFTNEDDNSRFWHQLIWEKLELWSGDLRQRLQNNIGRFSVENSKWYGFSTMNFIETQNAVSHGKVYVPEMNEWISSRELLEAVTIPRKVE